MDLPIGHYRQSMGPCPARLGVTNRVVSLPWLQEVERDHETPDEVQEGGEPVHDMRS